MVLISGKVRVGGRKERRKGGREWSSIGPRRAVNFKIVGMRLLPTGNPGCLDRADADDCGRDGVEEVLLRSERLWDWMSLKL